MTVSPTGRTPELIDTDAKSTAILNFHGYTSLYRGMYIFRGQTEGFPAASGAQCCRKLDLGLTN